MENARLKTMTKVSLFGAISFVLMRFFEFPVPVLWPEFLKFDISEVPALIIGFAISPAAGMSVVLLKNALFLVTSMDFVGVAANAIAGLALVGTSSAIYARRRTMRTAIAAMAVGTVAMTAVMVPANHFIFLPLFGIKDGPYHDSLAFWVIPSFNLAKGALVTIITYFLYKRVSNAFIKSGILENKH